jgi:hypothetical protein
MRITRRHSTGITLRAILTTAVAALAPFPASTVTEAFAPGNGGVNTHTELTRPHVLDGDIANVIVRVDGNSVCSGTPITGTRLVITAAHCVLDSTGEVTAVIVTRDSVEYTPRAVLVDPRYEGTLIPHLDAAVLVMDRAIPGPAATLGDTLPTQGFVTLAGFQHIDTDGTLLRGTRYDDRPTPKGVTDSVIKIESRPSGCVDRVTSIEIAADQLKVGCGLIPGASGGGLFVEQDRRLVLLGIISTVAFDLSYNGVTPLAAVHELLSHPGEYTHPLPDERFVAPQPPITGQ